MPRTSTPTAPPAPDNVVNLFEAQSASLTRRFDNGWKAFVTDPSEPPLSPTPRDVVWRRGKTQVFRYRQQAKSLHAVPYLIVPWVGISRTSVLDMIAGNSYIEFLVKQGYDTYLLDWGEIAEEDRGLGFEEIVFNLIPTAIERVLEVAGADSLTLNGLCLGGTVSTTYLALHPDAPVKNFVSIVTPVDFSEGGMFRTWIADERFPSNLIVESYGGVPSYLMATAFRMMRPTGDTQARWGLWTNLDKEGYIDGYKAMDRWSSGYIGMPGRFFQQLANDLYRDNAMVEGNFIVGGQRVDLSKIRQPLLAVAAERDYVVPPACARRLVDVVSSEDKEYFQLPGGHISVFSGRQANRTFWPKLDQWLAQRSA